MKFASGHLNKNIVFGSVRQRNILLANKEGWFDRELDSWLLTFVSSFELLNDASTVAYFYKVPKT